MMNPYPPNIGNGNGNSPMGSFCGDRDVNPLFVCVLIGILFLAGCSNKETGKAPVVSTTSSQPYTTVHPSPTADQKESLLASFSTKSNDKQLKIYTNESSLSPLITKTTENNGETPNQARVPIKSDWEKSVKKETIFASLSSHSDVLWLLLTSEPAAGLMGKTLYTSKDNGKSWALVSDVSQVVDGYVTGVAFRDDRDGWIGATQHGAAMVPLYRTRDGGKSWSLQEIDIPAGYKYGNVYPPIFDEKDGMQGTLKIEFVSDTNKKTTVLKTTDGGETWQALTPAYLNVDEYKDNALLARFLTTINENTKALNDGNEERYKKTYSMDEYPQKFARDYFQGELQERPRIITSLRKPTMHQMSANEIVVGIEMEAYFINEDSYKTTTITYVFDRGKENWELYFIH